MLAIQRPKQTTSSCEPNLLPCKIPYSGPVNASQRYWNPETDVNGQQTSYFRGRKLVGRDVALPKGFEGVVLEKSGQTMTAAPKPPLSANYEDEVADEDSTAEPETHILREVSAFDRITVWSHDTLPLDADDPYTKGIQEWMSFAQNIHTYEPPTETKGSN